MTRRHDELVQQHVRHRKADLHFRGGRLGDGRARLHGVHVRDHDADLDFQDRQHAGRPAGHRHVAVLGHRRLDRRHPRRPLRACTDPAGDDPLVFGLHGGDRLRAEFRTDLRPAGSARAGLRRRMGGRIGADGRDRSDRIPRASRRHRAERLVDRLGDRGHRLHRSVFLAARRLCMACAVLGRRAAGAAGAVHPQGRAGT